MRVAKFAAVLLLVVSHAGPVPEVAAREVVAVAPSLPREGLARTSDRRRHALTSADDLADPTRAARLVVNKTSKTASTAAAYWNEWLALYPYFRARDPVRGPADFVHR